MGSGRSPVDRVTCASLPASALGVLAGLRRSAGISVRVEGDRAWVWWDEGDEAPLRAVLPVEGVELFEDRGGAWFRAGRHLPSRDVPDPGQAVPLARAVWPAPFEAEPPGAGPLGAVGLRLVRSGRPRPASAWLGPLAEVGRWADSAPSRDLEAVRGAISGDRAFLLGDDLPPLAGPGRFWGRRVLIPLGFQARPDLGEAALVEILGLGEDSIARLIPPDRGEGEAAAEVIPLAAFSTLSRAGVRLAVGGWTR